MGCPVWLTDGYAERRGVCVDLSGSGMALDIEGAPALGTRVEVILELPDGQRARADAEVVRAADRPPGHSWLGLRFTYLSQENLMAIHSYVSRALGKKVDAAPGTRSDAHQSDAQARSST